MLACPSPSLDIKVNSVRPDSLAELGLPGCHGVLPNSSHDRLHFNYALHMPERSTIQHAIQHQQPQQVIQHQLGILAMYLG